LLLAAANLRRRTILAVRNNRLRACLAEILGGTRIGAQGILKFFSTLPNGRNGVEDSSEMVADLLICDEAQRLALRSSNVFLRAPVTVIIYDESQILNIEEQGTTERLSAAASAVELNCQIRTLPTLHRCRGGAAYVGWVNDLLSSPGMAGERISLWRNDYSVDIVQSHRKLVDVLCQRRNQGTRVALVAAFTRSSGKNPPKREGDLGKVRIPETYPPVEWLMDPESEYVPFWVVGESNNLTGCASIYGSQGFEADHVGVVWGNDLVIRNGRWSLGDPENCYDRAPGSTPLASVMKRQPERALVLLRNRYRIFLTRGILGTVICCEDPETQRFLSDIAM